MTSTTTPPPVITCPSWCGEPHLDDWINDEQGQPVRLHEADHGTVAVVAEEHLTDGRFSIADPMISADLSSDQLTIDQAEQLAADLQTAITMARAILAGSR